MVQKTSLRRRSNKRQSSGTGLNAKYEDTPNSSNKQMERDRLHSSQDTQVFLWNALLGSLIVMSLGLMMGFIFYDFDDEHYTYYAESSNDERTISNPYKYAMDRKDYDIIQEGYDDANHWNESDRVLRQTNDFLTNYVCHDNDSTSTNVKNKVTGQQPAYCHPLLSPAPQRRTHYVAPTHSNHTIQDGELVMSLPRHLLIWDLDAMRDEFVRKELFAARHAKTGNALDSGAFLAAYLVKEWMTGKGMWKQQQADDDAPSASVMKFLDILPSYSQLKERHPVLWSDDELLDLFGKMTPTAVLVRGYKSMISAEYDAFCKVSQEFKSYSNANAYTAMRLNVISRSFGPGPPGLEEEIVGIHGTKTLKEEIMLYEKEAGVYLNKGCRAMSPILDMWDHHAKPNVNWRYHQKKRSFLMSASASEGIPAMQDIMVSYGKYTDTHLFSKFGFVNGDGSGYTEASIAIMHPMLDIGMGQQYSYLVQKGDKAIPSDYDRQAQKRVLVNYLRYDDGYQECITKEDNPKGYELKLLKLRHLQKIANKYDRWTYKISPRNDKSRPSLSSDIPITSTAPIFDPKNVKFDGSKIIATCRLIALTVDDYNGNAVNVLKENLNEGYFFVDRQTDSLEFRALTVLSRLTTGALHLYPSSVQTDISSLSTSSFKFQSKEWYAAQVRLGEMQSLEVLRSIATSGAKQMKRSAQELLSSTNPSLKMHRSPCPQESSLELLSENNFELNNL